MQAVILFVVLFAATTTVLARPQFGFVGNVANTAGNVAGAAVNAVKNAFITRYDSDNDGTGSYRYSYETSDGSKKEEIAELRNAGTDEESIAVTGHYSYIGDDGQTYDVKYTADENGFQPEGAHIPPSAGVKKPKLGVPSAAIASLAGK